MNDILVQLKGVVDALGATVLLPILIFVIALVLGAKPGRAFRAGLTIGVAFVGINLVLGLMLTTLGQVAQAIVTNTGMQRDIVDVGWPSAAAIAFGSSVGLWVIPIGILVNVALLFGGLTRTLNVDVWNFWHFAFVGSLVTAATGSLGYGLIAAALMAALSLVLADWTAKGVQRFYGVPGVSVPHLASAQIVPVAIGLNWLMDRIPGVKDIRIDTETVQRRLGVFGEPIVMGLVIGLVLGLVAYAGSGDWGAVLTRSLQTGVNLAAVMLLLPRMVKILMEGLIPVSEAARSFVQKRAGDREIHVGLDSAILIGHPAAIASSLILVPVAILLSLILPGNRIILFADLAVIPFVVAMAAPDGWLWFGYRDGLLEARRGGQTLRWSASDGLDLGHVTALAHHAGRTWVGGQHGLAYVEAGRLRRLPLPDDGMFDNIYAIVPAPGADGREADLWLHARAGIFQIGAAELRRAAATPGHRLRYRSFDALGGLANDPHQVLPLPTAVRAADGRLWFSTGGGVVSLDPARLPPPEPGPAVEIEAVSIDGARLSADAPLSLGPEARRIAIDYTAPSLAAPERLSFRYRLDGFDTDWVDAGRARQAIYTGLAPGDYAFRVVALNKDGVPSPREAVLPLRVARAFYRHPLFLAGAGLLLLAALQTVYRTTARRAAERVRDRLHERHRERERIARELHDTLLQGVQGLVLRFQAAADVLPPGAPSRAQLEQALARADQVLVEGRDRVRALRAGPLDTGELHEALAAAGEELAAQWTCGFAFTVGGTVRRLQPAILDEVYRIGHEALRNAFAHARAAQVTVDVTYRRAAFVLTVADDGCGIDPSWLEEHGRPDHWGLLGMRERAERIGARLDIGSGAGREGGRGTRVVLTLPARIAYRRRPFWRPGWLRGA